MKSESGTNGTVAPRAAPLQVVILDDDPLARERIANLLARREDAEVVGAYGDVERAAEAIEAIRPDLVFLDIELPGSSGFTLLERLESVRPYVIVVTAHEQHALRAFDAEAVDFLLKPFDRRRFEQALARAEKWVAYRRQDGLIRQLAGMSPPADGAGAVHAPARDVGHGADEPPRQPLRKLVITERANKILLDVDEVDWVEAVDYYARIHAGSKTHLIRRSLRWLEQHLAPDRFVRIHRSSIVNVDRVREITPWSGGSYKVRLADGTELRLSATRRRQLERLLGQSI